MLSNRISNMVIKYVIFVLITIAFVYCGNPDIIDKQMDVDEKSWDVNQKLKVELEINDTISTYNFFINVRNTTDYKFSNFFLFIKTIFPNGQMAIDTLECVLADYQGKWIGRGNGKYRDNRILFKNKVLFPMKGKYTLEIEHALRTKYASGIKSIGIRIEKNKTSN